MLISQNELYANVKGEIEFEAKDVNGNVVWRRRIPNIIKIFMKESLAHRLIYSKVWDINANGGAGGWASHGIDIDEFAAKYIVLGASYDENGSPLDTADTRFYTYDAVSGTQPIMLGVGAEYDGGLINAIPISEPSRPLKRIERVFFEPTYQPAGSPMISDDVRAMNNVVVMETVLRKDEYNGFGITANDYFTITEVALVAADEVDSVGACEKDPRDIFLVGEPDGSPQRAVASGGPTITIEHGATDINLISDGDQIKIVNRTPTGTDDDTLGQSNQFYLVIDKADGGSDITLDRTPTTSDGTPITGEIGIYRDGFKILSHRILSVPVKKSEDFEITIRWRIIMN